MTRPLGANLDPGEAEITVVGQPVLRADAADARRDAMQRADAGAREEVVLHVHCQKPPYRDVRMVF